MRKLLGVLGFVCMLASSASAIPACVSLVGMPAADCVAGGLTFTDFSVTGFNVDSATVYIGDVDTDDNRLELSFNPMLGVASLVQDIWFGFRVMGPSVNEVDLGNGGNPAMPGVGASKITEWVCTGGNAGPGGCGSENNKLGYLQATGGDTASAPLKSASSDFSVFKDIQVPRGGAMTSFSEGFTTGASGPSSAPEPMTFVLIGSGLLLLGIFRHRRHI
jgi:hypothetical protein